MSRPYPFAALVGVDDLRLALLLGAVNPDIGGVLVRGEKGTAKSTAVRGLASLLPPVEVVQGDPFRHDPAHPDAPAGDVVAQPVRIVELPVGATEDRVTGSLDLEKALTAGERAFEPGLLAAANRGILYVDEVNLLGDHLVDLLLDAAAMGTNRVEREGVSVEHPARFQLVGTMNPEEGELRPQLLDRFGLSVEVRASRDVTQRAEVVRRRLAYEADPDGFAATWAAQDQVLAERVARARALLPDVELGDRMLEAVVTACTAFEVDGLRADLVTARTARTIAAWEGRAHVTLADVRTAARLALPHRRRRGPFEDPGIDQDELDKALDGLDDEPPEDPTDPTDPGDGGNGGGGDGGSGDGGGGHPVPRDLTEGDRDGRGPEDLTQPEGAATPHDLTEAEQNGRVRQDLAEAERVLAVGATFDPRLLRLEGTGAGPLGRRSPAEADRGRYAASRRMAATSGTSLALAPTVRAAAPHQMARGRTHGGLVLRMDDLRGKVREGREGNLVLFVLDASGSMAARQRMVAVKGAVLSLLMDAYQRRDRVGLITFRGEDAAVALPPTASVELAARQLADLPTGGRTPLAAGLEVAGRLLAAEKVRDPRRRPLVLVVTDGRSTSPRGAEGVAATRRAARGLAARGVPALVVDTEDGPVRLGLAADLARHLGAQTVPMAHLAAGAHGGLVGVVRAATAA